MVASMLNTGTSIAVVDDDLPVRKALVRLLGARCFKAVTYGSAQEFINSLARGVPECLIVDLQMPEMTGLELQHHLDRVGVHIPTVVITASYNGSTRTAPAPSPNSTAVARSCGSSRPAKILRSSRRCCC